LNGTITTKAFPEIRVGFRLDIYERRESYYIESVGHTWKYPDPMITTFTVSRGQRNDPYPVYEKIPLKKIGGDRKSGSRLADMFRVRDTSAVLRAVGGQVSNEFFATDGFNENLVDKPGLHDWGNNSLSYVQAEEYDAMAPVAEEEQASVDLSDMTVELQALVRGVGLGVFKVTGGDQDSMVSGIVSDMSDASIRAPTKTSSLRGSPSKGVKK